MPQQYSVIYTFENQSNTKGSRSVALSRFKVTGDIDLPKARITRITYTHYHTSQGTPHWNFKGNLHLSNGKDINSAEVRTERFNSSIVKVVNVWDTLPTVSEFALLESIQTLAATDSHKDKYTADQINSDGDYLYWRATKDHPITLKVEFISSEYNPEIKSFYLKRVNQEGDSYVPSDTGTKFQAHIELKLGSGTAESTNAKVRMYYSTSGKATTSSPTWPKNGGTYPVSSINYMLNTTSYNTVPALEFTAGDEISVLLYFQAGSEVATALAVVPRAFTTLHLSGASTGGVAVGGFSSSVEGIPKFEVYPPAYFYGGIAQIGESGSDVLQTLGIQAGVTPPVEELHSGQFTTYDITFPKKYAAPPIVVACMQESQGSTSIGECSATVKSVSTTGCVIRVASRSSNATDVAVCWAAFGAY